MNKLRNKVFNIIFIILTISVLSFIFLFNIQKYIELKSNVKNSLNMATNKNEEIIPDMKPDMKPDEDIEINKDSNINSIENGLVAIKDMVMDSRVVFKENKKNSLLIYQKFKDFYWVQSIYKKDSNLIVEYSEQYFNNVSIIKGRQTIIKNINNFYVYKKGNLLYIKIIKEGEEYIVSL